MTRNAARAVGWGDALGTIEEGKYADLLVTDTLLDDPYGSLLAATEREVRLVVIAGSPRYGDTHLMQQYPPSDGTREGLTVGGCDKRLYLKHPQSRLGDLTFAAALATLEEATSQLRELEARLAAAPFSLSADTDDPRLLLDNDDYPPADPGQADLLATAVLPESIPLDPPHRHRRSRLLRPGWSRSDTSHRSCAGCATSTSPREEVTVMAVGNLVVQCLSAEEQSIAAAILQRHGPVTTSGMYVRGVGEQADINALEAKGLLVEQLPATPELSWLDPAQQDEQAAAALLATATNEPSAALPSRTRPPAPTPSTSSSSPDRYATTGNRL